MEQGKEYYKNKWLDSLEENKTLKKQLGLQKESIEEMGESLMSSSLEVGRYADHIIEFDNGTQKTFKNIDNTTINVGKFTKMKNKNGVLIGINQDKVNWFEVHGK